MLVLLLTWTSPGISNNPIDIEYNIRRYSLIPWLTYYLIEKKKLCRLCLAKCYAILYGDSASTNNCKDEVWGFCRHARKYMLSAAKVRPPGSLA